ncbi:hypothetical protein ACQKNC_09705 [Lysinibacillus sp. NPDC094177]|uniref:hypothetical protein n=1 Tax=Lysinibacillus sp. NPDC094177 TaxID=3390580 RepID=UPI003D074E14
MSFLELQVPVQVAIITASIGAITLFLNTLLGKLNLTSLKQRRYIDTISKERIEWLNKIRDSFVEYTTLTSELTMLVTFYDLGKMKVDDEKGQEYLDKLLQLEGVKQKIYLLLNPKEVYAAKLNLLSDEGTKLLLKCVNKPIADNGDELNNLNTNINFIQQVILKAEWKRIVIEIEQGKKLESKEVSKIFQEVAKYIDKERNEKLFSKTS